MIIVDIYGKCDAPAKFIGHLLVIPSLYCFPALVPSSSLAVNGSVISSASLFTAETLLRASEVSCFPIRLYML